MGLLLYGALAEELTGVPKKNRQFRLELTKKELKRLSF